MAAAINGRRTHRRPTQRYRTTGGGTVFPSQAVEWRAWSLRSASGSSDATLAALATGPQQLDRLHRHWQHEPGAHFLFLTRGQRSAVSAVISKGAWQHLSWADVARLSRAAAASRADVAPGVRDYIATLEAYHRV